MKLCQCGRIVELERECYAVPTCFACLPPPEPLPVNTPRLDVDPRQLLLFHTTDEVAPRRVNARGHGRT